MKTELERLKVLSALKLGYGKLTAKNTTEAEFKNIEDAIEIVKNCSIPAVVGQSEQFYCTCSRAKGLDHDEEGMPYCIECQKPVQ